MTNLGLKGTVAIVSNLTAVVILTTLFVWKITIADPALMKEHRDEMRAYRLEFDGELTKIQTKYDNDLSKLHSRDDLRMEKLWSKHGEVVKAINDLKSK